MANLALSSAFGMWQVLLKPDSKATVTNRVIDVLPDRWITTWQCVRHRFNRITTCPQSNRAGEGGSNYIAEHRSRSHHAVIRVYDPAGDVIEAHEHKGDASTEVSASAPVGPTLPGRHRPPSKNSELVV